MTVTDHILTATDGGEISLLCLIDLSKCFDIDHTILLRKVVQYGVETCWFQAYITGHTQCVLAGSQGNQTLPLPFLPHLPPLPPLSNMIGVCQGSALGPLLFTVFANDFSLFAGGARVVQYTDE